LGKHYGLNGNQLGQHYKDHLSDYQDWDQKEHAERWMIFPDNMGTHLSIDESSFSNGELYHFNLVVPHKTCVFKHEKTTKFRDNRKPI